MKKIFTIFFSGLMASSLAVNAEESTITLLPTDMMVVAASGCMPVDISPNGEYVVGGCSPYAPVAFSWNVKEGKAKIYAEDGELGAGGDYGSALMMVIDDGTAFGSGYKVNLNTGVISRHFLMGGMVDDCTDDGKIFVGMTYTKVNSTMGSPHTIDYQACYWENSIMRRLPVPSEEELGYYYLGTRARMVSGDGSIIVGEIVDRLHTLPMIIWRRQANGTYQLDPVCMEYFDDIKYNQGYFKGYVNFRADALSNNGKYVAMTVREAPAYGKPATGPLLMAYYDTETGELTKVTCNGRNGIAKNSTFNVYYHGISDNGTVTGGYTDDITGAQSCFIMYMDEKQPIAFTKAFPNIDKFFDFEWDSKTSSITPDGKHITGCGWVMDYQFDPTGVGYYQAFVLNVGDREDDLNSGNNNGGGNNDSAVEAIGDDSVEISGYYSLDGKKLDAPVKGINIVRYSDGTSRKVIL